MNIEERLKKAQDKIALSMQNSRDYFDAMFEEYGGGERNIYGGIGEFCHSELSLAIRAPSITDGLLRPDEIGTRNDRYFYF